MRTQTFTISDDRYIAFIERALNDSDITHVNAVERGDDRFEVEVTGCVLALGLLSVYETA